MEYKIWDKKESINNVSAEEVLNSMPELKNSDVILLIQNNRVTNIEDKDVLISNLNLDSNLSVQEVAEKYIQHLEELKKQEIKEKLSYNELLEQYVNLESCVLELAEVVGDL
nr:MAG TPA: hypothetical protein [Caudoviricetes sp.]